MTPARGAPQNAAPPSLRSPARPRRTVIPRGEDGSPRRCGYRPGIKDSQGRNAGDSPEPAGTISSAAIGSPGVPRCRSAADRRTGSCKVPGNRCVSAVSGHLSARRHHVKGRMPLGFDADASGLFGSHGDSMIGGQKPCLGGDRACSTERSDCRSDRSRTPAVPS